MDYERSTLGDHRSVYARWPPGGLRTVYVRSTYGDRSVQMLQITCQLRMETARFDRAVYDRSTIVDAHWVMGIQCLEYLI